MKVAIINDNGTERVHADGCRDIAREENKTRNGGAIVIDVDNRQEVALFLWADIASDSAESGTPKWEEEIRACDASSTVYLPCCKLPETTPSITSTQKETAMNITATTPEIALTPTAEIVRDLLIKGFTGSAPEIAEAAGTKLTATKVALHKLAAANIAAMVAGHGVGKNRVADQWSLKVIISGTPKAEKKTPKAKTPKTSKVVVSAGIDDAPRTSKGYLVRGQLCAIVVSYLSQVADQSFTAPKLAQLLGGRSSSGAVAYSLDLLVKQGMVERVSDKPRMYKLAA